MQVRRVLLLLNRASGTGQGAERIARIQKTFADRMPAETDARVEIIEDHPAAKTAASGFLIESKAAAAIIVGGGGGTLRAVVEGICEGNEPLPGKDRIRLAALRLGSGNVVAKQFGVPLDPEEALRQIGTALQEDATAPCCVIRCDTADGCYCAVTMAGFGQFGRAPGDLVRWHRRLAGFRKLLARVMPLERLNDVEYLLAMLTRTLGCALLPSIAETVEVTCHNQKHRFRLFSGVLLNFHIPIIPLDPQAQIEEKKLSLYLVSLRKRLDPVLFLIAPVLLSKRALHFTIGEDDAVDLHFPDRNTIEFFLDEDPVFCSGSMKLRVAGTLAFVPGNGYKKLM